MAAEYYRPTGRRRPADAGDPEHGPNGFDLHAMGGNLCRCTGYRPIRDAAWALGAPADDDALAERQAARPAPAAGRAPGSTASPARPTWPRRSPCWREHPDATVVAGATDWGVEVNLRGRRASYVVAIDRLPELRTARIGDDTVEIGAALTLSEVEHRPRRRGAAAGRSCGRSSPRG